MARRGRPTAVLILSEEEREALARWARRPKSSQQLALRARIVLACAEGATNTEVAAQLRVARPTVGKWRSRFVTDRLDGLGWSTNPAPAPRGRSPTSRSSGWWSKPWSPPRAMPRTGRARR